MKEEPLLLLSDLQKLINQVVLIDYPYFYDKTSISFNPQTSIYLKSVLNKIPPIG